MNTHGRGPLADATYRKSSSSSDFSQKVLSPLHGPAVSDKKKISPSEWSSMSEDSIERKKKIGVCFCIYMVAVLQRNVFSRRGSYK